MNIVQRAVREPALVLGLVTAGLSLAVLFGVDLSVDQLAGVGVFLGALMALVRYLVTPASEVVVQEKPSGELVAGAASDVNTGATVRASVAEIAQDY